jgi:hypothetical protein
LSTAANGDIRFHEGHWRLELDGALGTHSGSTDRSDDFLLTGTVDYEFPATAHTTLGLRLLPLFIHDQDKEDTVWGAGFGFTGRLYQKKDDYAGLFGEIEATAVVHSEQFVGNESNLNFMTGFGLGYQFRNKVHLVMKYRHISNAGLGDKNQGINTLGLGIGFSF